jgi:C4-dicarboxylate transporter, DctM subunit
MEPIAVGIVGLGILFLLIFLGMPIGFAMGLIGFLGYAWLGGIKGALGTVSLISYSTMANYVMSVIPLYIFLGFLVFNFGVSKKAYDTFYKWLGALPGGLAISTIGACAAFAACCGSSVASASVMTPVAWPEMKRYKYDPGLALGTIAAGGTLGIMIPPSIPFVIYALFAEESVGKLFMAGFFPGILLSILLMLSVLIVTMVRPQFGPSGLKTEWREKIFFLKEIWEMAALALIILGGIWGGFFTPTEAGGISVFFILCIALVKRVLRLGALINALKETVKTTSMLFIILIGAMIFNNFLAISKLPAEMASFVGALKVSPIAVLCLILFIYLVLGCLMDTQSMMVLTLPIFLPIIKFLHIDLVWFGVLLVLMCEIGLITPPIGINVFVVGGMARDVPLYTIFRGILPLLAAFLLGVFILVAFPQISLFLPNTMMHH